ncbi:hypothetical protein K438DRAFT_1959545 [Mycena galopus ATCC 62051]|nr:hypothetical protein K438DRAFT_1959545 [Mycena galopus ATCC 62051]
MAWDMLRRRLQLGHSFFMKYRKEFHFPDSITDYSPASMLAKLQEEVKNLTSSDDKMWYVLAYYPHHNEGTRHERDERERLCVLKDDWLNVIWRFRGGESSSHWDRNTSVTADPEEGEKLSSSGLEEVPEVWEGNTTPAEGVSFTTIQEQDEREWKSAARSNVNGNADDPALPSAVESHKALNFFTGELKILYAEVMRKFERWCVNRENGEEEKQGIATMHADVSKLVQDGLREVKHNNTLNMEYTRYNVVIREGLGVKMAGWPPDVPIDRAATINFGAIHWVVMTKTQHDKLTAEHNAKLGARSLRKKQRSDARIPHGPRAKKDAPLQTLTQPQPQAQAQTQPMVLAAGAGTTMTPTTMLTFNIVGNAAALHAPSVLSTEDLVSSDPAPFQVPPAASIDVPFNFTFPPHTFDSSVPVDVNLDMDAIAPGMPLLPADITLPHLVDETPFPDSLRLPTPPPVSPLQSPSVLTTSQAANKRDARSLDKEEAQ